MNINDAVSGFRLLKRSYIEEVHSESYTFIHEKSGARLFALLNDDDNKVFSISFRTPPADNTGVAHIVEHSTLCGSRKYPLKEPFVELVKGSLNTFLNAMTYPDKTIYPVASRNDKDFQNLMDVYLDAVFYPAMLTNPQILMQEGWHYEIDNPKAPLTYSGVVYNEMKGALSAASAILESRIMTSLYPDTTYGFESGGDPEAIPTLTQEMFVDFHSKYYHPANSYIYLYGDINLEEKLAYLDREYLSHFDKITVPSNIVEQQAFSSLQKCIYEYPIGQDEDTLDKTFLALNWQVGSVMDTKTMMGLSVLEHALICTSAAPLRQALVDARLGKDVDSIFETELLQPFFSIVVENTEAEKAEEFRTLTMSTLQSLADNGIDRTLLEASLNLLEFRLREDDFGSAPKGLVYGIRAMKSWLYDGAPEEALYYEELLKEMRIELDKGYFEELIRTYFLKNNHQTLVILKPSQTLADKREEEQKRNLAKIKAQMSEETLNKIIYDARDLQKRQQSPDTEEALKSIPLLSLKDISTKSDIFHLEEKEILGTKILHCPLETNGIGYLNIYFDAQQVPQDKLPYLYLLVELLGDVDTRHHSYAELANLQNLHTGGISYSVTPYTIKDRPDSCQPKFCLKAKALTFKFSELCQLIGEIISESIFTDAKRIRELMEQAQSSFEINLQNSAHQLVAGRIASYLTPAGRYADEGGLPFYHFLKDVLADFDNRFPELAKIYAKLIPQIFNKKNLLVNITLSERDYETFAQSWKSLDKLLSRENFEKQEYHWDLVPSNEGITSSSRVQYVGKGANFLKLGYKFNGSMLVLSTLLRYDYLWTKIRVQGGAYGAFVNFSRNGIMNFGSYRDPHLKTTLDIFDATMQYIYEFDVSDREMDKAIIGTISRIDASLTPKMKGETAMGLYLRHITDEDRQLTRKEVLSTRQADIRALAKMVNDCMQANILCVFGGEEKIKANKTVFGSIVPAL